MPNINGVWNSFNRDINRGCLVYIFSMRFSGNKFLITGVEIRFFCLTDLFWKKSHCSSSIAIKDFGGAVSPLVDPAFTGNFLHFSDKEVPGLQKINLFTLIKYFSQKIPSSIAILFPTPLKSKAEQGLHFPKANTPRDYTVSSNTNTLKNIIPLICKALILYKKNAFS